ncbi:hypothetical protein GCM10027444_26890 [Actinopolyspora lacussalsi]
MRVVSHETGQSQLARQCVHEGTKSDTLYHTRYPDVLANSIVHSFSLRVRRVRGYSNRPACPHPFGRRFRRLRAVRRAGAGAEPDGPVRHQRWKPGPRRPALVGCVTHLLPSGVTGR